VPRHGRKERTVTKQKHLKRRIRERMRKTGESYTTARLHILRSRPDESAAESATPDPIVVGNARASATGSAIRLRLPRVHTRAVEPSRFAYAVPVFTILLFILVALTGCADGTGESRIAASDSVGIRIVVNLPGSIEAAEAWTLSDDPLVDIGGGVDPATPLFHVTDIAPLDDGRVAVAMNRPPQVHVFDEDGRLAVTLGGEGSGPGEFASVASLVPVTSDSIAVWDADRRRISTFDTSGRFVREVDVSDAAPASARAAPSTAFASGYTHLFASGGQAFIIFGEGALGPHVTPGIGRPALPAVRISTTGDVLAEFGPVPGMEMAHAGPAGGLPLPFGARTSAATSGEMLIVGTGDVTQFQVSAADGEPVRIVRWPDRERIVGGHWLDEWTAMVAAAPPPIRELVELMPRRERFPAYDYLMASDEGHVVVGEYAGPIGIWSLRRPDEGPEAVRPVRRPRDRRWLVFDPDGVLTATLRTPEGFAPASVDEGRIWGVFTDTLDIESVRAYRILR
jgi:hypothetical protein